jgi:hypothetical protein
MQYIRDIGPRTLMVDFTLPCEARPMKLENNFMQTLMAAMHFRLERPYRNPVLAQAARNAFRNYRSGNQRFFLACSYNGMTRCE